MAEGSSYVGMATSWRLADPLPVPCRSCPTVAAPGSSLKCGKGSATRAKLLAWHDPDFCDSCYDKVLVPTTYSRGGTGGHAILSVRAGTRTVGRVLVDRRALPMDLLRLRGNERNVC